MQTWERKPLDKMGERKRGFSFLILPQGGFCSAVTQDLKGSRPQGGEGVRFRAGRCLRSCLQGGEGGAVSAARLDLSPELCLLPKAQTLLSPFLPPTTVLGSSLLTHHQLCPLPPSSDVSAPRRHTRLDPDHLFSPETQRSGHSSHHMLQFILSINDTPFS